MLIFPGLQDRLASGIFKGMHGKDDVMKKFQFIKGISHVDDKLVQNTIARFALHKLYMEGYGYSYLRSMIVREHNDAPKKKLNERKRYGKPPSKRIKENAR